jgi:nucleoside 2-deoxyribosyltransferase
MRIYIAGPLGFSEAGRHFYYKSLIPSIRRLGIQVLDPWKLTSKRKIARVIAMPYGSRKKRAWRLLNKEIGANNCAAIDRCDALVAVLDGTDVDSGTAAEVGYAFAKAKPIIGYRGDFRLSADNESAKINLQVEYFVWRGGGCIVESFKDLKKRLKATARAR